jgi:hypothetical protein
MKQTKALSIYNNKYVDKSVDFYELFLPYFITMSFLHRNLKRAKHVISKTFFINHLDPISIHYPSKAISKHVGLAKVIQVFAISGQF